MTNEENTQQDKAADLSRIEQGLAIIRDEAEALAKGPVFAGRKRAMLIYFALNRISPNLNKEKKFKPDNDPGPYYQQPQADGVEWDLGEEVAKVITFESVEDFVSKKPNAENFDIEAVSLAFFEFLLSKVAGPGKTIDEHWSDFESVVANSDAGSEGETAENEAEAAQQGENEVADVQAETQATTEPTTKKSKK